MFVINTPATPIRINIAQNESLGLHPLHPLDVDDGNRPPRVE
jgi:hypothetical protein